MLLTKDSKCEQCLIKNLQLNWDKIRKIWVCLKCEKRNIKAEKHEKKGLTSVGL